MDIEKMIPSATGRIPRYSGKSSETSGAALAMIFALKGLSLSHASCLTGRPFQIRVDMEDPRRWMIPWRPAWEGIQAAVRALGVASCAMETCIHPKDFKDLAAGWLLRGPILLGPLNPRVLWDRLEWHFHAGGAHWLILLGMENDDFLVHDPEGCPFSLLPRDILESAMSGTRESCGVAQPGPGSVSMNPLGVILACLRDVKEIRRTSRDQHDAGAHGLTGLAKLLRDKGLSSSAGASLNYGLPALGLARFQTSCMFASLADLDDEWKETHSRMARNADAVCRATALGNQAVHAGSAFNAARAMEELALWEADFDEIIEEMPCI